MANARQISWEDTVRAVDPEYDNDNLRPYVYFFPRHPKREDQTNLYQRTDE